MGPSMSLIIFSFLVRVVAVVFIISNAIVTAVAVWNLSIVQGNLLFCESLAKNGAPRLICTCQQRLPHLLPRAILLP